MALALPMSWGLQHKPDFTFTALHNDLSGPPLRDSFATHLASVAFFHCRGRFNNPFLVSFLTLKSDSCSQSCQMLFACFLGLEPALTLNYYIYISFPMYWPRKLTRPFPFTSCRITGWGLALKSPLPLLHLVSGFSLNFSSPWSQDLATISHFPVPLFSSNCAFCISLCPLLLFIINLHKSDN